MRIHELPRPLAKEDPYEYAQRRANETGRAYIVSNMGHAMVDTRLNRHGVLELGCTVEAIIKPEK